MKRDLEKVTLNLRLGDWDYLRDYYAAQGLSASQVIRALAAKHVDLLRSKSSNVEVDFNV